MRFLFPLVFASSLSAAILAPNRVTVYSDNRPVSSFRLEAKDTGVVLRHNDGTCPNQCDNLGARDLWVFESGGVYYIHYDASGSTGWLSSLAVSNDLVTWVKRGPILSLGAPGSDDSKSASYGVTFFDGSVWHMFYLGTPNVTAPPDLIPSFPYLTLKAKSASPGGPWTKQYTVTPFRPVAGTFYNTTASPGQVVTHLGEYLQFFSASTGGPILRTLGIARTKNLDGPWTIDLQPIVPAQEQVENSSLYYEPAYDTWFIFTNHIGSPASEYTDAVWVYWTRDLNRWDAANKAVVLDSANCAWAKGAIGLPGVIAKGGRLAVLYDAAPGNSTSHMGRDLGLSWLTLPLVPLYNYAKVDYDSTAGRVRASSAQPNWPASKLVDGERRGVTWASGGGWQDTTSGIFPDWVEIEFKKPRSIRWINLFTLADNYGSANQITLNTGFTLYGSQDFVVQYWNSSAWITIPGGTVTGNTRVWRQFVFAPVLTSKIRVTVQRSAYRFSNLVELEAWGTPIRGCTNNAYTEYDSTAEIDDGSCTTVAISFAPAPAIWHLTLQPVSGGFLAVLPTGSPVTLQLLDLKGHALLAAKAQGRYFLSSRGLIPGLYILRVNTDRRVQTEKVLLLLRQ